MVYAYRESGVRREVPLIFRDGGVAYFIKIRTLNRLQGNGAFRTAAFYSLQAARLLPPLMRLQPSAISVEIFQLIKDTYA